eukprot:CAMPEP_0118944268 /NCGR_PEP_ID=MMETSP1169-20130426/39984_1 /TAXON_ID=36882 /ORGANISM="Pyramimonas obovata, Strain CCMP722" /LENGTH=123 /DNA_ID=CAMNT_0006889721 /DNA_START=83 /DNA_END=454 /DNA_ORIENTATION=-
MSVRDGPAFDGGAVPSESIVGAATALIVIRLHVLTVRRLGVKRKLPANPLVLCPMVFLATKPASLVWTQRSGRAGVTPWLREVVVGRTARLPHFETRVPDSTFVAHANELISLKPPPKPGWRV